MSEEQKRILQQQLWALCSLLRGRMAGDEFRDYILGFIFFKFLSERLYLIAQEALSQDGLDYATLDEKAVSGSLLLRVARQVKKVGRFYGQELNRITFNLARMNMILRGVHDKDFDTKQSDTLERPRHLGLRFEAIVANLPFSLKYSTNVKSYRQADSHRVSGGWYV